MKLLEKFKLPLFIAFGIPLIISHCIFVPEDPEEPIKKGIIDFLNFKQILDTSHYEEQFDFRDYEELFIDSFSYHNVKEDFSKKELLRRIAFIENLYTKQPSDSISVLWKFDDTSIVNNEPKIFTQKDKEITLAKKRYEIIATSSGQTDDYFGTSTFKLVFNRKLNEWVISYWLDEDDEGDKSFFNPIKK